MKRRMRRSYGRRKRRRVTRRTGFNRVKKSYARSQVHNFVRMTSAATLSGNVAYAPYLGSSIVRLSDAINSSEITNLFDQYRINYAVFKFWLRIDPGAQTAATASYPKLYWYRDYDDSTAAGSLNEMRENSKCRVVAMNPNRPITVKFKPNILNEIYSGVAATTYTPKFKQWIDCSTSSTTHYGFKWAIDDLTNTNYRVDIETKLYFQARQPR